MNISKIHEIRDNLQRINSMMYLTRIAANTKDIGANENLLDSLDMMYEMLDKQIQELGKE